MLSASCTNKKDVLVALDGNWLLHRAFSTQKDRHDWKLSCANLVTKWVYDSAIRLKATHIAFCFDGEANFRYGVYDGYKGSRGTEEGKESPYLAIPLLQESLKAAGIKWLQHPKYEADDLLVSFAAQSECLTYLVTRDKDINQSLTRPNVFKYTPEMGTSKEIILSSKDVALGGLSVLSSLDYQILVGDAIDNIPGIIGPAQAKTIIKEHATLKHFLSTKEGKRFWSLHQQELIRNRKLVRMVDDIKLPSLKLLVPKPSKHPRYVAWANTKNTLF